MAATAFDGERATALGHGRGRRTVRAETTGKRPRAITPSKRAFDIVFAALLGVLSVPLVVTLALISWTQFGGSPFFAHPRVGLHGRSFRIIKIRSLPRCTPIDLDAAEVRLIGLGRFSRFLRTVKLDELPQLWQVVRGSMTLVGPRPAAPEQSASFDPTFDRARTSMKPGLTGLWQIGPLGDDAIDRDFWFDYAYLANRSLALDLWVVWRTGVLMVTGRRASVVPSRLLPVAPDVAFRQAIVGAQVRPPRPVPTPSRGRGDPLRRGNDRELIPA